MASIKYRIAQAVIAGRFGNGPDRIQALTAAGYDPAEIQHIVNAILMDDYTEPECLIDVEVDINKYDGINIILRSD